MRSIHVWFGALFIFSVACKPATDQSNCQYPSGRYINTTVLENCPNVMPFDVPHFCFEMTFRDSTRVEIDNGFEKFTLPYRLTEKGCRFIIPGATAAGDIFFQVTDEHSFELIDTSWTRLKTFTSFRKSASGVKDSWRFKHYINECVISGEYDVYIQGKQAEGKVTIMPNGQVNGLKPYLGYSICFAGDCLEEVAPPSPTIEMVDQAGQKVIFAMKMKNGKNSVALHHIGPPIKDEKGGRAIGEEAYELRLIH